MAQPIKNFLRSTYNLKVREVIILLILSCLWVEFARAIYLELKNHFSTLFLDWGFWIILPAAFILIKFMGYMIAESEKNKKTA